MESTKISVYALLDNNKVVTRIESSISNIDSIGEKWTQIDEGNGDKYAHAQNMYLEKGLVDEKGRYNYKYDSLLVELTEEEKNVLFPPILPVPTEVELLKQELITVQEALDFLIMNGGI